MAHDRVINMNNRSRHYQVPLLNNKHFGQPSVFTPDNLLRESRRQKAIPGKRVPEICILDPDGDIVRYLQTEKMAQLNPDWACYHTRLYDFSIAETGFGIIGFAVGASFAVLVAEELFASGCRLLLSFTSAGQITAKRKPPYFILIESALRDEGTSYHYLPPAKCSRISETLLPLLRDVFSNSSIPIEGGAVWTTDAPFRETKKAIEYCRNEGISAVEMEAAALYAFAAARKKPVICFAHVTNQMGATDEDFEKGYENGSLQVVQLISSISEKWLQ